MTRPDTPLPWINYLGARTTSGSSRNTAGGYSFYRDARLRRLTRYRYNNAPLDTGGRYLYLRDDGERRLLVAVVAADPSASSTTTAAATASATRRSAARRGGIDVETLYFVPQGETLEIWRSRVTNDRRRRRRALAVRRGRVLPLGRLGRRHELPAQPLDRRGRGRGRRDLPHDRVPRAPRPLRVLRLLRAGRGFDTPATRSSGRTAAGTGRSRSRTGRSGDSIAHGWAADRLAPRRARARARREARDRVRPRLCREPARTRSSTRPDASRRQARVAPVIARHLRDRPRPTRRSARLRDALGRSCSARCTSTTGDEHVDRMVNIWNPYQCMVTFNLSRSASLFESGIGRGMGFRDSNQDLLGLRAPGPRPRAGADPRPRRDAAPDRRRVPPVPAAHEARERRRRVGVQRRPAVARPRGRRVPQGDRRPRRSSTSPSRTTTSRDRRRRSTSTCGGARVHARPARAARAAADRPRGLERLPQPELLLDEPGESFQTTANHEGGVAESVFIAALFVLAADELAAIARLRGERRSRARSARRRRHGRGRAAHGWDGEWFRRAYDDGGAPGRLGGERRGADLHRAAGDVRDGGDRARRRARRARRSTSVRERLTTPHGIVLVQPAYTGYRSELGEITSYPPGYKENGGVFCHTNPWVAIAETLVGDGDAALDDYLRINPSAREATERRPPVRAVRLRPDDRRPRRADPRRGEELVADGHRGVELRRGDAVDPRAPARSTTACASTRASRPPGTGSRPSASSAGATYRISVRKERGARGRVRSLIVDGAAVEGTSSPCTRPEASSTSLRRSRRRRSRPPRPPEPIRRRGIGTRRGYPVPTVAPGSPIQSARRAVGVLLAAAVAVAVAAASGAASGAPARQATTEVVVTMKAPPLAAFGARSLASADYVRRIAAANAALERNVLAAVPSAHVRWRYRTGAQRLRGGRSALERLDARARPGSRPRLAERPLPRAPRPQPADHRRRQALGPGPRDRRQRDEDRDHRRRRRRVAPVLRPGRLHVPARLPEGPDAARRRR